MSLETVLEQVNSYDCPLVEVTGGEPLSQSTAFELIARLSDKGFAVLIETSGAIDISPVDSRAKIIMDIKCPGSEMDDRMRWDNLQHIAPKDQIKFVISDRRDYDWAVGIVKQYQLTDRCPVLFSPVFAGQELRPMAEWILEDRLPVRFQIQLHKFIWAPDTRGV
jgi:7-carboxy-7-deazaguanine synthase